MKSRLCRCLLALSLLLFVAVSALAGTYSLTLPYFHATYGSSALYSNPPWSRTQAVNFGRAFSIINSVSIAWSGQNYEGLTSYMGQPPFQPYNGVFSAYLKDGSSIRKTIDQGGDVAGAFGETEVFSNYLFAGNPTWDFLLDGQANLSISYGGVAFIPEIVVEQKAYGNLDSVTITVDGVEAPEPSAFATLFAGLACAGGLVRRRRRK